MRLICCTLALCGLAEIVVAHPLDEVGICHDSTVHVGSAQILVRYNLWFAEIPAYRERKLLDRRNGPTARQSMMPRISQKTTTR